LSCCVLLSAASNSAAGTRQNSLVLFEQMLLASYSPVAIETHDNVLCFYKKLVPQCLA